MLRFWCHVYKTTRDYVAYLRESHTDLAVFIAFVLLILTTGDRLFVWSLGFISPTLASRMEKMDHTVRVLLFGVPPATIALIIGIMRSGWLELWRQNRRWDQTS